MRCASRGSITIVVPYIATLYIPPTPIEPINQLPTRELQGPNCTGARLIAAGFTQHKLHFFVFDFCIVEKKMALSLDEGKSHSSVTKAGKYANLSWWCKSTDCAKC